MTGSATQHDGAALLAATAELGGYFAIPRMGAGEGADLSSLILDEATVSLFVDRTRAAIAGSMNCDPSRIPVRMAASSFHLNVVSRLISPVIGAAASLGRVPLLDIDSVKWQSTDHHSPRFGTAEVHWAPAPSPIRAAESISASILGTVIGPFNETLRSTHALSTQVSRGNTISAANGAVNVMAMSRPDLERAGRALVRALLETGPLMDTGTFDRGQFVRRSCCLFYQAPQGGLCQDCVLTVSGPSHPTAGH